MTGKLCHAASPHSSCLTFIFPALVMKKERKCLKIPTHTLQTASSARISPSQAIVSHKQEAYELRDGDIPQCSAVARTAPACRARPRGQMERSHVQTTPRLARRLSYVPALHPPILVSCRLRCEVHTSVCADAERRITSSLVSGCPGFSFLNHKAVDYNWLKCDTLLHRGDKKFCHDENQHGCLV